MSILFYCINFYIELYLYFVCFNYSFMVICFAVFTQKEKPPINVVGDVTGRIAIVVVSRTIIFDKLTQ